MKEGAVGSPADRPLTQAATGSVRPIKPRSRRLGASLVLVTDPLPPADPVGGPATGLFPDDPATAGMLARVSDGHGAWVGREPGPSYERSPIHHRRPLRLDPEDVRAFDLGQSRSAIWPLYHDLAGPAQYHPRWRRAYRSVNAAYARAAADEAAPGATVWVNDYRLQLVPTLLRRLRPDVRIGFHLRTPFPAADLFRRMPLHRDILAGLLGADLLGFQTASAAENFLLLSQDMTDTPSSVGVYPVAPDTATIRQLAARSDVIDRAHTLRRRLGSPTTVILAINTADQSQGVERRLLSLDEAFQRRQLRPGDVAIIQVLLGPTTELDQSTGDGIARAVARVNGQYAAVGRPCVHYLVASPDLAERVALYLAADLMLATPLREGATMPALEFVAAARSQSALVLSEFSGTAAVLPDAYIVNPYDDDAVRTSIDNARTASANERTGRMRRMRDYVLRYDNHTWAGQFLSALTSTRPQHRDSPARKILVPRRSPRSHRWHNIHNGGQP